MASNEPVRTTRRDWRAILFRVLDVISMPALALILAFVLGALIIFATSGSFDTVISAYVGLVDGALFKQRGLSETLIAMVPYIFLSLAVSLGFKAGLFNIGVEGQFYMGAVTGAYVGTLVTNLPAIIALPLVLTTSALAGAIWAAIPGYLKARTGAHEVINTIMMNYIAFRLSEYIVSNPLRNRAASAVQTPSVAKSAELWSMFQVPERLGDPLNALLVALLLAVGVMLIVRWWFNRPEGAPRFASPLQRRLAILGIGVLFTVLAFFALPPLVNAAWPFTDQYDRIHIGVLLAPGASVFVWWLLWRTTRGFEMRTVGANPDAARYAGISITRTIVLSMAISGAFAGIAGVIEVLGVSTCRCLPVAFVSGYGFDSIAISLLAKNDPFGILGASFLFGAMRNGADLMELNSGVSKYVISLIQALALLFVATPALVRFLLRRRQEPKIEEQAPLTRGWGG